MSPSPRDKRAQEIADIIACRHTAEPLTPLGMAYDIMDFIERDPEIAQRKEKAILWDKFSSPGNTQYTFLDIIGKADGYDVIMSRLRVRGKCHWCEAALPVGYSKCPHCHGTHYVTRLATAEEASEVIEYGLKPINLQKGEGFVLKSGELLYMERENEDAKQT